MSDEGGVMPSDVTQDVAPQEVAPACGQSGSRHYAGTKAARPGSPNPVKPVTAVKCRANG